MVLVEDACWRNEWVVQMEEAETLAEATSSYGSKFLLSDGLTAQQQPFR